MKFPPHEIKVRLAAVAAAVLMVLTGLAANSSAAPAPTAGQTQSSAGVAPAGPSGAPAPAPASDRGTPAGAVLPVGVERTSQAASPFLHTGGTKPTATFAQGPARTNPESSPPGGEFPFGHSGSAGGGSNGNLFGAKPFLCNGVWPGNELGQRVYEPSDCYGHDEPGMQFYSSLPGSGGNFSESFTLPTDRSPTQNQTDLYTAVWLGMTLSDPYGWLGQCFLELQFYPDQTWYNPSPSIPGLSVNGAWIAQAVAWQIQARTGHENPCFIQPLFLNGVPGPAYLNMTQGDSIAVRMTGWVGNPLGEAISVQDLTNGQSSHLTLFNSTGNYPLNPAYSTNSWENSLEWTPGGEYPVVWAFETGHAIPPNPENNTYGGCSPGVPPPTFTDPAVPCPSYDASAWINDTGTPWLIQPPVFFNSAATSRPSQVGFTQDFGGFGAVDTISNGACAGAEGSAWCTYPWYSYSCTATAFEFGATDWAGVSNDFGKYSEYGGGHLQRNGLHLGFYPPANYSMPACGQPMFSLTVGVSGVPGGAAYFLSRAYTSPTSVGPLVAGDYSAHAISVAGSAFTGWTSSAGVAVADPLSAWTTVNVTGGGTLTATFAAAASPVTVTFTDSVAGGLIVVSPSFLYTTGAPIATVASGNSLFLAPGVYGIQALPPAGYNFSRFTVTGSGSTIAAPTFPYTWLLVSGSSSAVSVVASYVASLSKATVETCELGGGNVSLAGGAPPPTGFCFLFTLSVGTYHLVATPSAKCLASGCSFYRWYALGGADSMAVTDWRAATNITFENGTTILFAFFWTPILVKTLPTTGGGIAPDYRGAVTNGHFFYTYGVDLATLTFEFLNAVPGNAETIKSWSVSSATYLNFTPFTNPPIEGTLLVFGSGSVTATYQAGGSPVALSFFTSPAAGGAIQFNYQNYSNGAYNGSVSPGAYELNVFPAVGYRFVNWVTTGRELVQNFFPFELLGVGGPGNLTAVFQGIAPPFAVTFAATNPYGSVAEVNGMLLTTGETVWLPAGNYPVTLLGTGGGTFVGWTASSSLLVTPLTPTTATLTVSTTGGTLIALVAPFALVSVAIAPASTEVGVPIEFAATVTTGASWPGALTYRWSGLPPGCIAPNAPLFSCVASAAGSYPVSVNVTDGLYSAASALRTITVAPHPSLSALNISNSPVTSGVVTKLSTSISGGVGPFTWSYLGLPTGCVAPTGPNGACAPTATGIFHVTVTVTDSYGFNASSSATWTVNPSVTVTASAGPSSSTVGSTVQLTAVASGGTTPLSIVWTGLPTGCGSATVATVSCVTAQAGAFGVSVTVTDRYGVRASAVANFTVVAGPGPSTTNSTPVLEWILLGLVAGLVAGVAVGWLLRRRPPSTVPPVPMAASGPGPTAPAPEWDEQYPPPSSGSGGS
ncbi:MAG: hypothetical protein L3K14_03395 [Thermoplasmata archaeon]|nr:hypothetical protein [Thermoplasmata archaeon]